VKVEVKKLDKVKRAIKIEIGGEGFSQKKKEIYKNIGKNLKVPGFRPGAASPELLERHYGKTLKEEFIKQAVSFYYQEMLEAQALETVSLPRIHDVNLTDISLTFSAEVEVRPTLELDENSYKGIKIKDKKIEIKDQEIDKLISTLKESLKKATERELSDDELSKWSGYPDTESLRNAIKTEMTGDKLRARRQDIENQVINELLKRNKVDVPPSQAKEHQRRVLDRQLHNLRLQGMPEEEIKKHEDELTEKIRPVAEREVKLYYILENIAKRENLKIGPDLVSTVLGFILSCAEYK